MTPMLSSIPEVSRRTSLLEILIALCVLTLCGSGTRAQVSMPSGPGGPVSTPMPGGLTMQRGDFAFERPMIDFSTQGLDQENCINIPLTNKSDRPRLLTGLASRDPSHFAIMSPIETMLPMSVAPHSSIYVNLCFKADKEKEYRSSIYAAFGDDTASLALVGRGVKRLREGPLPTKTEVSVITPKKKSKNRTVAFELPFRCTINLEVENMLGKTVRRFLINEVKVAGHYEIGFNGKDDNLVTLPKGIYFIRLEVENIETHETQHATTKLVIK
jgi:hypothetical protein